MTPEDDQIPPVGAPPPPPAFGTVIKLDHVEAQPAPAAPAGASIKTVVLVAGLVSIGVAAATWFAVSQTAPTAAVTAAAVAPKAGGSPAEGAAPPRAAAAAAPAAPAKACPDGMVEIDGGSFFMGTDADDPVLRTAKPAHKVEVESFCIDLTEVTVAAYRTCSDPGKCKRAYRDAMWPQGKQDDDAWAQDREAYSALCNEGVEGHADHPVNCVSWHQATAFCESRGGRLPSEAEWEFAARGSDGRVYSWGDAVPDSERMNGCGKECVAWREAAELSATPSLYDVEDGYVGTAPVGSFPAGLAQAGLSDMAGNVFEWTATKFESYDEVQRLADAKDEDRPLKRVIRGGAFNSFMPAFADPALRFGQVEDAHPHAIGFRCAATPNHAN